MKKDSSVSRALKEVPLFAARYENFIKRLENQSASLSTIKNYGYNLALICLALSSSSPMDTLKLYSHIEQFILRKTWC